MSTIQIQLIFNIFYGLPYHVNDGGEMNSRLNWPKTGQKNVFFLETLIKFKTRQHNDHPFSLKVIMG